MASPWYSPSVKATGKKKPHRYLIPNIIGLSWAWQAAQAQPSIPSPASALLYWKPKWEMSGALPAPAAEACKGQREISFSSC